MQRDASAGDSLLHPGGLSSLHENTGHSDLGAHFSGSGRPLLLEHPSEDVLTRGAGRKQHLKPTAGHFSPGVLRQVLGIGHIRAWGAGAVWSQAWLVFQTDSELLAGTWEVGLGLSGGICAPWLGTG